MRLLAILTAIVLPLSASATQAPIDVIEAEARAEFTQVVSAPNLPLVPAEQATACAMSVDPLPAVLVLAGATTETTHLTYCFQN